MPTKFLDKKTFIVQVQRGGRRRTRRGTGTEADAKKAESELLADLDHEHELDRAARLLGVERVAGPKPEKNAVPTLREYFEQRWVEHAKVVHNPTTRIKSEFPFKYLLYYLGDRRLDELLEPKAINAFVEAMKSRGPTAFQHRKDGSPRKLWCQQPATPSPAPAKKRKAPFMAGNLPQRMQQRGTVQKNIFTWARGEHGDPYRLAVTAKATRPAHADDKQRFALVVSLESEDADVNVAHLVRARLASARVRVRIPAE